jgi:hypothetical protein
MTFSVDKAIEGAVAIRRPIDTPIARETTVSRLLQIDPESLTIWVDFKARRYMVRTDLSGVLRPRRIEQLTIRNSSWNGSGPVWVRLSEKRDERLRWQLQAIVTKHLGRL